MADREQRRQNERAFERVEDTVSRVRRPRKTSISNDKFSVLLGCLCGREALLKGEVEYPLFGGYCEGCGRPLNHVTVVTATHARELQGLLPTLAGQRHPPGPEAQLASVLVLAADDDAALRIAEATTEKRSEVHALMEFFRDHPEALKEVLERAEQLERPEPERPQAS